MKKILFILTVSSLLRAMQDARTSLCDSINKEAHVIECKLYVLPFRLKELNKYSSNEIAIQSAINDITVAQNSFKSAQSKILGIINSLQTVKIPTVKPCAEHFCSSDFSSNSDNDTDSE